VGRAAGLAEARGAVPALAALGEIPAADVASYQPYWALRGHLLTALGRAPEAREAYARAIGLSEDPAARDFLHARTESLD
jgi:RNA polymerase sigma-70 factor (ECF subfamily)